MVGTALVEDFDGDDLDLGRWLPHYLPAWSSRARSRAHYRVGGSTLVLDLPPGDAGLWCPDDHDPPLRVSAIQSGSFSGPVGSTVGQQPFRDGQTVREEQPRFEGHLQAGGRLEVACRMELSARSMAALWLVGFEDEPDRCAEICVVEVFGKDVEPGSAEVGMGLHAFRDPAVSEDFAAPRLPIDVTRTHTYAVEWDADVAVFSVDGEDVRSCPRPPAYPLQVMVAVFDFPRWSTGDDADLVPALFVERVVGEP